MTHNSFLMNYSEFEFDTIFILESLQNIPSNLVGCLNALTPMSMVFKYKIDKMSLNLIS